MEEKEKAKREREISFSQFEQYTDKFHVIHKSLMCSVLTFTIITDLLLCCIEPDLKLVDKEIKSGLYVILKNL